MFACWNRHHPEQDIAAQNGYWLAVDASDPARVVRVAQHKPGAAGRRGVQAYRVRRVARNPGRAVAAAVSDRHRRLGCGVLGQDDLLVRLIRLMDHLAQCRTQARRDARAGNDESPRQRGGVLQDAKLIVDVHLAVLRLGSPEDLLHCAVFADGRSAKQGELAAGLYCPHTQARGRHPAIEHKACV